MEIEAKFLVSGRDIFDELMHTDSIYDFSIMDKVEKEFRDTYLDTVDMAIYASGFSFRSREKADSVVYTLKSLESSDAFIHMREETELVMPEKLPVRKWEKSAFKNRISGMIGSGRLYSLFTVQHKRTDLQVYDEHRHIAELSFDDVTIDSGGTEKSYLELEVELMVDGTEAELNRIASFFKDEAGLTAGSGSKFVNGLELVMDDIRKDAQVLDYGLVSDGSKISFSSIRDIFEECNVEQDHARKVAENSLTLFDSLKKVHLLRDELRHTMKIAALVHDIGVMTDVKTHHKVGRDILFEMCPEELPWPLCVFLPWTTFLHKKRIDEQKLQKLSLKKKFSALPAKMQEDILRMSAILRIADALDYSRLDTQIVSIDISDNDIIVKLKGPGAESDSDRADTKADLWRLIFEKGISFRKYH